MSSALNISEVVAFFRTLDIRSPSVLAAVSGGADSVALVHLLREYQDLLGIGRLAAAHVNHGLRGEESDGDEAFVRGIAGRLGIEFFCIRIEDFSMDEAGIEERARRLRYDFFSNTAKNHDFDYIATAHTASDQAETVLMRLIRGTGVRGLRGIRPEREDGVIRPLLGIERHELEGWLSEKGLAYRTDSSNADDRFRRNFIRNRVMPLLLEANPAAVQNIAACAAAAARVWEGVEDEIDIWIERYVPWRSADAFHIEKAGLTGVAPEALTVLFEEYGIRSSRRHIARVMDAVNLSSGEYLLSGGWKFYPREERVCFVGRTPAGFNPSSNTVSSKYPGSYPPSFA